MPSVSIVVPVFNEVPVSHADHISPRILSLLALLRAGDEIILVDGGSTDVSWAVLQGLALNPQIRAIQSLKGRALQMNAGAACAQGDALLFLHSDTDLTAAAWHRFLCLLARPDVDAVWGRFDVQIKGRSRWLPVVAWFMNQRSRLSKIGTGDQALFVGRALFDGVGGFPEQPLMEDIELCKRLKRRAGSQFIAVDQAVITSGRRWDENGAWRTIVLMWRFRFQYWRGVSPRVLAQQYADTRAKLPLTVAVFAKYPQAGRVKTRLAPLLGEQGCAAFARYLLLSTLDKLQGVDVVLWTDGGSQQEWTELLGARAVQRCVQPEGHLGLRMQTAVETHLKGSKVVVLLGPDAVEFKMDDLHSLVRGAVQNQFAFVPAHDGGYVAMACTRCVPDVFSGDIAWGTATVAAQTRAALQRQHVHALWLPAQLDIDEPADLAKAIEVGCLPADWLSRY